MAKGGGCSERKEKRFLIYKKGLIFNSFKDKFASSGWT